MDISRNCCCVGTVQLVEIATRVRIGVLDLRVAVVLDARPHRWRACRRWCQGIYPSADAAYEDRTVFRTFRIENWRLGRVCRLGQPRFQVGNSTVLEPQVGPGGCETFVECAVVGGELAHALFEGGVLGDDPLDGILCPFGFQIADAPEEFADASALSEDLGVGGLECVLGAEGPLTPGRFT